jgi:hypothetical protein
MAAASVIFNIPAIDEFCRVLRNAVTECGGAEEFFKRLTEETQETYRKLITNPETQETLRKIIEDTFYQHLFINQITNESDKAFVEGFLQGWRVWSEFYPIEAEGIRLQMIEAGVLMRMPIPKFINDVFSCSSNISLESFGEEFMVSSIIKLAAANKELGGPNTLLMSATLTSFVETIRLMLNSLKLRDSEIGLFKISEDRDIISTILNGLNRVQESIEELRTQFENMR